MQPVARSWAHVLGAECVGDRQGRSSQALSCLHPGPPTRVGDPITASRKTAVGVGLVVQRPNCPWNACFPSSSASVPVLYTPLLIQLLADLALGDNGDLSPSHTPRRPGLSSRLLFLARPSPSGCCHFGMADLSPVSAFQMKRNEENLYIKKKQPKCPSLYKCIHRVC